ncbi:MAG: 50S ribosomal L9 C-terminal domain-containing protein, partial [Hyphomicrobiales bacterium]
RSAGETGQLYGSVSARDIADSLNEAGYSVSRAQVTMEQPIKTIGMHVVPITLHPEVDITVTTNIARSPDEATRQAAGEDLSQREEIELDLEVFDGEMDEFFEEGARSDDDDAEDTDAASEAEAETADDSEKE